MEIAKCRYCKYYDPSPYPEYKGKLAVCRSDHPYSVGLGKIGFYTLASRDCFEWREELSEQED